MAKEWILNMATNRWGLNKKRSVGPVSAWIRKNSPKNVDEWEGFYYNKLKDMLKEREIDINPSEYLINLGKVLYVKITEVIRSEIDEVAEEDCINYIKNLVINRTYDGYITEKETIYGQLQDILGVKIESAPDKWDRRYNVDFYIEIKGKCIGLQIKPETFENAPEAATKWKEIQKNTHEKFTEKFGGKVFIVISVKKERRKVIYNKEVVDKIKKEIEKLSE